MLFKNDFVNHFYKRLILFKLNNGEKEINK